MSSSETILRILGPLALLIGLAVPGPLWAGDPPPEGEESSSRITDEVIPLDGDIPRRPPPIIEIGDPFLGAGPISEGFEIPTGAVWNPAIQVFGTFRSALQSSDDGVNDRNTEWVNRLDIFANLDLTQTERILVGLRPLDNRRGFTGQIFEPSRDRGWEDETDVNLEVLFFEGDLGELFPNADPSDTGYLDFGFAVGRQPLLLQDGLLVNDELDAVGVVRNTLRPGGTSNLRLTAFAAWNDIHRTDNFEDESATLFGLFSEADLESTTLSFDSIYVASSDSKGDGLYFGGSATQRLGPVNTTFRLLASFALDGSSPAVDSGALAFAEVSYSPHGTEDLVYANGFWGVDDFNSAARAPDAGGPLGRTGILFEAVGLGNFGPALSNSAEDVVGAAVGYQWIFDETRRQLVLEVGGRADTDGEDTSAAAIGARFQQALGRRVILQPTVFGGYAEGGVESWGARLEILVKL